MGEEAAADESRNLAAVVHSEPAGGYWAEVTLLPGCYTQAETLDELVSNLQEAVACYLEAKAGAQESPSQPPRVRTLQLAA